MVAVGTSPSLLLTTVCGAQVRHNPAVQRPCNGEQGGGTAKVRDRICEGLGGECCMNGWRQKWLGAAALVAKHLQVVRND